MVPLFGNSKELAAFTPAQFGGSEEPFCGKTKAIRQAKRAAFKADTASALRPVKDVFYGVKCG